MGKIDRAKSQLRITLFRLCEQYLIKNSGYGPAPGAPSAGAFAEGERDFIRIAKIADSRNARFAAPETQDFAALQLPAPFDQTFL
ncbi:MAG: hypothetical protein J2P52_09045 [Blastocatellia bacterium]|nr:hypothetical protein [Blastocatellia bacterium]